MFDDKSTHLEEQHEGEGEYIGPDEDDTSSVKTDLTFLIVLIPVLIFIGAIYAMHIGYGIENKNSVNK